MNIGIDALFLVPGENGGGESYLRNLLKALEIVDKDNSYFIFCSKNAVNSLKFKNKNMHIIECNINNSNRIKRVLYQNLFLPSNIKKYHIDIMFFPTFTRCFSKLKGITTVSNIHDLQYLHFPENFRKLTKRILVKTFYPFSIKNSQHLVAISEFVKGDIINFFGSNISSKIKVIHNPIDFKENDIKIGKKISEFGLLEKKYILSVASFAPHKNLETLIKSYGKMMELENFKDYKLVLVGINKNYLSKIETLLGKVDVSNKIIITGYVDDQTLNNLYKNSAIYVCTSLFEGFGMPPIEAMYYKIPVVSTRLTALEEVTMGKVIYYDEPFNYNLLYRALVDTIHNYPSERSLEQTARDVYDRYNLIEIGKQYKAYFESLEKS